MKCDKAKDWLLQAETPAALSTAPREVDEHVRACPECRRLLQKLVRLEEDWRALPSPPGLEAAQWRMLKKAAAVPPRLLPRRSGFRYVGAWAAAAAILIAAGIGIWFAIKPNPPPKSNVIDQLIAWNLDLSQVRDKNERQRLFQARLDSIKTEVQSSPLGDEEKQLAGKLLDTAAWLTENDDPLDEADRFSELADEMVERLQAAPNADAGQLAKRYTDMAKTGINANLERLPKVPADRALKLEKLIQHEQKRAEQLSATLKQAPAAARPELRNALAVTGNHPHKKGKSWKK
jgi:hypothetical protein